MYQDQDGIKVFERQHARDRIAELARDLNDPPDDDLFATHACAEGREGLVSMVLSIVAIAVVVVAVAMLWK